MSVYLSWFNRQEDFKLLCKSDVDDICPRPRIKLLRDGQTFYLKLEEDFGEKPYVSVYIEGVKYKVSEVGFKLVEDFEIVKNTIINESPNYKGLTSEDFEVLIFGNSKDQGKACLGVDGSIYSAGATVNIFDDKTMTLVTLPIDVTNSYGFVSNSKGDKLYSIPGSSQSIVEITTLTRTSRVLPHTLPSWFKFTDGTLSKNGSIYYVPNSTLDITKLDTANFTLVNIPSPARFQCATSGKDGNIYIFPENEGRIMIVNTENDSVSFTSAISGNNKFTSCTLINTGEIIVAPSHYNFLGKFDTDTSTLTFFTTTDFGTAPYKFIGGIQTKDGHFYTYNNNIGKLVRLNPVTGEIINLDVQCGSLTNLVFTGEGRIVGMPSNSNKTLISKKIGLCNSGQQSAYYNK